MECAHRLEMRDGKLRNDPEEHQFPIFLVPLEAGDGGDEDMETNLLAGFLMLRDCHTCVPCMFMANCFIPCVLSIVPTFCGKALNTQVQWPELQTKLIYNGTTLSPWYTGVHMHTQSNLQICKLMSRHSLVWANCPRCKLLVLLD